MTTITIEVVADDRDDAMTLLSDAVRALRRKRETSGQTESACIGDYRVTVTEAETQDPPYKEGDRVCCRDLTSVFAGSLGTIKHSGPMASGVLWDGTLKSVIHENAFLKAAT